MKSQCAHAVWSLLVEKYLSDKLRTLLLLCLWLQMGNLVPKCLKLRCQVRNDLPGRHCTFLSQRLRSRSGKRCSFAAEMGSCPTRKSGKDRRLSLRGRSAWRRPQSHPPTIRLLSNRVRLVMNRSCRKPLAAPPVIADWDCTSREPHPSGPKCLEPIVIGGKACGHSGGDCVTRESRTSRKAKSQLNDKVASHQLGATRDR